MNEIEYWKIIVMAIAIVFVLFEILWKKSIKTRKTHVMAFIAMVLVLLSVSIRSNRENTDWVIAVFAVSIGLGNLINIFRSKKQKTEPEH